MSLVRSVSPPRVATSTARYSVTSALQNFAANAALHESHVTSTRWVIPSRFHLDRLRGLVHQRVISYLRPTDPGESMRRNLDNKWSSFAICRRMRFPLQAWPLYAPSTVSLSSSLI